MAVLTRALALSLLLAATLAGCTRDPLEFSPAQDQLMVHGVMEAGSDTVVIRLTETVARERGLGAGTRGVRGAAVELAGGGVTTPLREYGGGRGACWSTPAPALDPDAGNPGCYLGVVPGGVRAGERYELRITLDDGRRVRGEARVPAAPELRRPADGERWEIEGTPGGAMRIVGPLVLEWRHEPALAALTLSLQSDSAFRGGVVVPDSNCGVFMGNLVSAPEFQSVGLNMSLFCQVWSGPAGEPMPMPDSLQVRLRVVFFDTAFVRYRSLTERGASLRRNEAALGLEGAAGVFSAAAVAERRVIMVPRP
jgi:hypothetical protein